MVRIPADSPLSKATVEATTTTVVGKASGGFTVALALASPLLMVASLVLAGLLMGGASGATGLGWLVGSVMFGTMGVLFVLALFVAETSNP